MVRLVDSAAFWNKRARKYAASTIKDMPGYERTVQQTAAYLDGMHTVLEFGCGTGTTALRLAPHVRHFHATDISQEMVAIAREKAGAAACHNATFDVAETVGTAAPDGGYDAVLAFNILHLIADRPAAYRRIVQVLKPGGLFISKTTCLSEMNPFVRLAIPAMQVAGVAPHVAIFSGNDLAAEIAAAGFSIDEQARHGSKGKDPRIFIVARRP